MTTLALLKANYDSVQYLLAAAVRKGNTERAAEHRVKLANLELAMKAAR